MIYYFIFAFLTVFKNRKNIASILLFQVWHDFVIFLIIYLVISLLYRCILVAYDFREQRQTFELLCIYADRFSSSIPLSFLTGFYVTQVVNRWWEQFMALPWPDQLAFKLLAFVPGNVRNAVNILEPMKLLNSFLFTSHKL